MFFNDDKYLLLKKESRSKIIYLLLFFILFGQCRWLIKCWFMLQIKNYKMEKGLKKI